MSTPGSSNPMIYLSPPMRLIVFLLITCFALSAGSQIVWTQRDDDRVWEVAREEDKMVLLYFSSEHCGACVLMDRTTLQDSAVIALIGQQFVFCKVNSGSAMDSVWMHHVEINLFPTFLFLDETGKEIHRLTGSHPRDAFLSHCHTAAERTNALSALNERYAQGQRDSTFLYKYILALRDASKLEKEVIEEYWATQSDEDLFREKNIRLLHEFCVHQFEVMIPFGGREHQFMQSHVQQFYPWVEPEQIEVRLLRILLDAVEDAISLRNRNRFDSLMTALEPFDCDRNYHFREMDGRLTGMIRSGHLGLLFRMAFADQCGTREEWITARKNYVNAIRNDAEALNSFAWSTYERARDKEKLRYALKCSRRAIRLSSEYVHLDTRAWLHYALGDYKKAIKASRRAIIQGKKESADTSETERLLGLAQEALARQRKPNNCWC